MVMVASGVGWKRMFFHVGQERPCRYPLTCRFQKFHRRPTLDTPKLLFIPTHRIPPFSLRLGETTFFR